MGKIEGMKNDLPPARKAAVEAYIQAGTIRGAARLLGKDPRTIREHIQKAGIKKPVTSGEVEYSDPKVIKPRRGGRVFILTCAQNNTPVHEPFLENLVSLAGYRSAELLVAKVIYNHHAYLRDGDGEIWYDPKIATFPGDRNIEIAPDLIWNGEVNILPTAVNPLSGLDVFNGPKSGIFPHTKIAMSSVATGREDPSRFVYTTGTVTQRNYVPRKAGQKASFHHAYGALIVEVDSKGRWFARQINAREDGSFQDLDVVVADGKVSEGNPVEAIVWGDVHVAALDPDIETLSWGEGGILDTLRPKTQVFHDLLDFRARNHHDRRDPHLNFRKHLEGTDDVADELRETVLFLSRAARDGVESVVVPSNHDDALTRWLREADYREDPKNALVFLRLQARLYEAIARGEEDFHVLGWALGRSALGIEYPEARVAAIGAVYNARWLHVDESHVVAGVELGNHGHLGVNGSRGNPRQFARTGRKSITGHTHSAGIIDGVYTVGTSTKLSLSYTRGPSSWSHTHAVLYPNGKRALVTIRDGKWRA